MTRRVLFAPEALQQLVAIHDFVADAAGGPTARRYTEAIVKQCRSLARFPLRGSRRDDLIPGLRTIGFRRRVTIAFRVASDHVLIVGVLYGGQDLERALVGARPS